MPDEHPTVLVAVHNTNLRIALVQGLRQDGYLVLEAADSDSALHIAQTHSRPIHIVLIHISMADELRSAIRQYRPKTQALIVAEHNEERRQDVFTPETTLTKVRGFFNS